MAYVLFSFATTENLIAVIYCVVDYLTCIPG